MILMGFLVCDEMVYVDNYNIKKIKGSDSASGLGLDLHHFFQENFKARSNHKATPIPHSSYISVLCFI